MVSLIGALLKEKPNRWRYYLGQLQQKQFKRIRKSSSYDYDALDQAMSASIEVLPDEHRELYKDLTVLEKDVKIPAKVCEILLTRRLHAICYTWYKSSLSVPGALCSVGSGAGGGGGHPGGVCKQVSALCGQSQQTLPVLPS